LNKYSLHQILIPGTASIDKLKSVKKDMWTSHILFLGVGGGVTSKVGDEQLYLQFKKIVGNFQ
jgi:hypothetical protein